MDTKHTLYFSCFVLLPDTIQKIFSFHCVSPPQPIRPWAGSLGLPFNSPSFTLNAA